MKFIPLQTSARVNLRNMNYTLLKFLGFRTCDYSYVQHIFEVREGVPDIAGKRRRELGFERTSKTWPGAIYLLGQPLYRHRMDLLDRWDLSAHRGEHDTNSTKSHSHFWAGQVMKGSPSFASTLPSSSLIHDATILFGLDPCIHGMALRVV